MTPHCLQHPHSTRYKALPTCQLHLIPFHPIHPGACSLIPWSLCERWSSHLKTSPAPHTHTLHVYRQTLPTFQLSSGNLPPQGILCPFPLGLLLCPITSSQCRPLLHPIIINLKCLCICLSLNCELAEGMDATKPIYLFF